MTTLSMMIVSSILAASFLAVLVELLGRMAWLRRRPAMMHVLWLVVLAKFIMPAVIPLEVLPAPATDGQVKVANGSQAEGLAPADAQTPANTAALVGPATKPAPGSAFATVAPQVTQGNAAWTWIMAILAVWTCGIAWLLARSIGHALQFRQWLRQRSSDSPRLTRILQQCQQPMKCPHGPQIRMVRARCSPFLWAGARRMCIYVPQDMAESLPDDALRAIIGHELAHYLRYDAWANLFAHLVTTVCWWNPLAWRSRQALREVQELCCDALVIERLDLPRRTYATVLYQSLDFVDGAPLAAPLLTSGWGGLVSLKTRFQLIGDAQVVPRVSRSFALLVGTVALGLLCFPMQGQNTASEPPPAQKVAIQFSATAAARIKAAKDHVESFTLRLAYTGDQDKPFYNLLLSVPKLEPAAGDPFSLQAQISREQAFKLIDELAQNGYFERAVETNRKHSQSPPAPPYYSLSLQAKNGPDVAEWLGWDFKMLKLFDTLREQLDGDAAKALEKLAGRLNGYRQAWTAQAAAVGQPAPPQWGEAVDGLRTRLKLSKQLLRPGEPVELTLDLENTSTAERKYGQHSFIRNPSAFEVIDEQGNRLPYLAGGAGLLETDTPVKPGEVKTIEAADLSSFFYLRRPGKYSVAFHPAAMPASNHLEFTVTADAATNDGDPIGRLLANVPEAWTLVGNPNRQPKIRPGRNHAELPGWQFIYIDAVKGFKGSKAAVWLWLTNDKAAEAAADDDFLPASEYLGQIDRWHAYLHATPEALAIWPSVKADTLSVLKEKTALPPQPKALE